MLRKNVLFLGLIGGLGIASTDIYVPALPKLAQFYEVSSYLMNLTMTSYFLFTGIGTLIFLRLSKTISNATLNLFSLLLFSLGGILISLNESYWFIVVGRGLQGLGFGVVQTNIVSFIRKSDSRNFAKNMATYSLSAEFLCLFTPLIGVLLFENIGWRAPFLYIGIVALIMLIQSRNIFRVKVQNVLDIKQEQATPPHQPRGSSSILKKDGEFWIYNFVSFLLSGIGWALISISPYLLENGLFSDWGHGIFYMAYTIHYMVGNFILERISHELRPKVEDIAMKLMGICSVFLVFAVMFETTIPFIAAMMLLGTLSGMLYGVVFEKAQQNLGRDNERLLNSATTIMLLSRLVASGTFTAFVSWLFIQNSSLSLLFGSVITMLISTLLFVGRVRSQRKISLLEEA